MIEFIKEVEKKDKMRDFAEHLFSTISLINSVISEHKCMILFIMTLNLHFIGGDFSAISKPNVVKEVTA